MMERSHKYRWLTALVLVPVLFAVVAFGSPTVFALFVGLFMAAGMYEYNNLAFPKGFSWVKVETMIAAVLLFGAFYVGEADAVLGVLVFATMALSVFHLLRVRENHVEITPVIKAVFGLAYVPLLLSYFLWIRRWDDGVLWIFFIIVLAFSGDVAAYYVGRKFGHRKLIPAVSAGKSIAGTVALFTGSAVACCIYAYFFLPRVALLHAALLGFTGSVIGQLGDLCESVLKRAAGAKDSGGLLPGHGGVLDRLDCLLFIAPYVYYFRLWVIG
ncbi:MAG: phosphatidate cytidylyltransferase [Syntrophales bacterium]|nr:phosphatidate cytidylyltransferase [Syntrophales bacterium]